MQPSASTDSLQQRNIHPADRLETFRQANRPLDQFIVTGAGVAAALHVSPSPQQVEKLLGDCVLAGEPCDKNQVGSALA